VIEAVSNTRPAISDYGQTMVSGAFHDALYMARVAPAAMIFVPCRDGLSHNEAEYVEPAHCIAGTRILLQSTLQVLATVASNRADLSNE
jgi:N-carbamoyl-L-amino-acid hydrolase